MAKFTKNYNVQPNEKQRAVIAKSFKSLCEYFLNVKNSDVNVVVEQFDEKRISVQMYVNNAYYESRIIGVNGGVHHYFNQAD